jgi:hypothetical protein
VLSPKIDWEPAVKKKYTDRAIMETRNDDNRK